MRVCSGKTGAGFQSDNSELLAMTPVYPCHFLSFVVVSKVGDSSPCAPAIASGTAEYLQEDSVNPADLFR